jgi:hypothetical protein
MLHERTVVMKSSIICFLAASTLICGIASAHEGHGFQLIEELEPLQFQIGSWVLEWEGDNGVKHKMTSTNEVEAKGHAIRKSGQYYRDGEHMGQWINLIFVKDGKITQITVGGRGNYSEETVTLQDDTVVFKSEGTRQNGDTYSHETHSKMVDENSVTSQRVNIVVNGEARDDWPAGTWKRVK